MAQHTVVVEQASAEEKKKRKKLPFILGGIGVLALVPLIGSTFAASISLGTGAIEFGQGTQTVAACDADGITVALGSAISSGDFKLQTITLSGIDLNSSAQNCAGKTFKIHVADSSNALQDWIASGTDLGEFSIPASAGSLTDVTSGTTATFKNASGTAYDGSTAYDAAGVVTITVTTPYLDAGDVGKILLETSN